MDDITGAVVAGIGAGWIGGKAGFFLGGPIGAIVGAVAGSLWGDDLYDFINEKFDFVKFDSFTPAEREGLANMINNGDNSAILYPQKAKEEYHDKLYLDFVKIMKYFNEDGSVNFAKYLADTANISLYDPIALDLDGNGKIDTLSLENGVFFDHNGDKVAFKSSWVNSSDGILARDIDGDGKITSGAELFGNFTKLKNGELAKNGKEALSDLDSDENGVFDERDEAFGQILVWQDFNSNGKAESGELKSLSEHGIKSINLEFSTDNTALDKDNKQILVGSFAINDSDEALASDIDFSVNTIEREMAESAGLVKGTGFVRDFKPNLSKEIEGFYTKYKELESKAEQIAATDELVGLWAKTAKQYKEIDNPIQKVKINISSVASNTTSSGINEAIKRAEAREITLSDGVKISA